MTQPTKLEWIPWGTWGSRVTLARMAELAHAGRQTPLTRQTAVAILGGSRAPGDRWSRAQLLRRWLSEHVRFRADPVGPGVFGAVEDLEQLTRPEDQLAAIQASYVFQGDCDDLALLSGTLALVMGLPARFRVVGFDPAGGFSHVFTEVLTERGWLDMDVTRRNPNPPPVATTDVFNL